MSAQYTPTLSDPRAVTKSASTPGSQMLRPRGKNARLDFLGLFANRLFTPFEASALFSLVKRLCYSPVSDPTRHKWRPSPSCLAGTILSRLRIIILTGSRLPTLEE
jgi:hypothetical protein